jgi:hypothetical protein
MSTKDNNAIRIKNSSRNLIVSAIGQVFIGLFGYFERKVFIDYLADSFLGMNDLFANILRVLCLAEMGFGSSIVFCLYKPLAENNTEKLKSLMRLFKKAYITIGTVIIVAGIAFSPFIKYIAQSDEPIPYLVPYFILYLISIGLTYFFSYKSSLIHADQKKYIVSGVTNICTCVLYVASMLALMLTKSYALYLVLHIISNLVMYLIISRKADKMYPFLKERKCKKLEKEEKSLIKRNVVSMVFIRLGDTIVNSSDNIIISTFLGLSQVAMYSNYLLLKGTCITFLDTIAGSINASIGNVCATEGNEYQQDVYKSMFLVFYILATIIGVFLAVTANDIIRVLFSPRFVQSTTFAFVVALNVYLHIMRYVNSSFSDAHGLFWANKVRPFVQAIANLVFSLVLLKFFGILGVVLGTTCSILIGNTFYEPFIIFRELEWPKFGKTVVSILLNTLQTVLLTLVVYFIVGRIEVVTLFGLLLKAVAVLALIAIFLVARYWHNKRLRSLFHTFRRNKYK